MGRKPSPKLVPAIEFSQQSCKMYSTVVDAKTLTQISYVVVRRQDDEVGAVQRVLDTKRIKEIAEFYLDGGPCPSSIILNWVSKKNLITKASAGKIRIPVVDRVAQILDGQHRVEGFREAMTRRAAIAKMQVPVVIYQSLTTQQCADIFLSINSLQRPVAKSLVTDLYSEASSLLVDPATQRARDLADMIHEDLDSAYRELVKFPNSSRGRKGIPLSTITNGIKPLVDDEGMMPQVGLIELRMQRACFFNFFNVLKKWYGENWESKDNVFMAASGFTGAIDFLKLDLIPLCNNKKNYTEAYMKRCMNLDPSKLIDKSELSGLQGRAGWNHVRKLLKSRLRRQEDSSKIKF